MALFAPRVFVAPEQDADFFRAELREVFCGGLQVRRKGELVTDLASICRFDRVGAGDLDAVQFPAIRGVLRLRRQVLEPIGLTEQTAQLVEIRVGERERIRLSACLAQDVEQELGDLRVEVRSERLIERVRLRTEPEPTGLLRLEGEVGTTCRIHRRTDDGRDDGGKHTNAQDDGVGLIHELEGEFEQVRRVGIAALNLHRVRLSIEGQLVGDGCPFEYRLERDRVPGGRERIKGCPIDDSHLLEGVPPSPEPNGDIEGGERVEAKERGPHEKGP